MNEEIKKLIDEGFQCLQRKNHEAAIRRYTRLTQLLPAQPIGYLGLVHAKLMVEGCTLRTVTEGIMRCKGLTVEAEYCADTDRLLNMGTGKYGNLLLVYPCLCFDYDAAEVLVDLGIDVHHVNNSGVNALWYVCHDAIPENYREDGRRIAKMLLDMDVDINVKNQGGVALLNSSTDREIAKMIRNRRPGAVKGDAPASSGNSGTSFALILGCIGAAIAFILGTVLDKFLASFLWAAILGGGMAFFGSQIDHIREEGRDALGKAIRNMLIALAVLVGIVMIAVGNFKSNQKTYGRCPGCGERMETKYIDYVRDRCTRCD